MWYHNGVHLADLLRQQRPELEVSKACDPGVTWGWTMVSDSDRGPACQDVQQCSGGQWYQIAGITQRKAFMQGKVRQQPGFEAWQAQIPASCTGSEQGLLRRARYLMAGLQRISAVYGQRSQRTQRWRSVIRQEQCIQDAVRSMVTGPDGWPLRREQVVVGWGSGGSSSGGAIPRKPGGLPLRRLAEELDKRAIVISTDEFCTSQCCSNCGQRMQDRPRPGGDRIWSRRVRACNSCRTLWHRDVNAARNILLILLTMLLGLERPAQLRRGRRQQQQ